MKRQSSHATLDEKQTPSTKRDKHPMHGYAYQINLSIVMLLHAYKLRTTNSITSFKLTVEDDTGGKFDDLVYRQHVSDECREVAFIQAKHTLLPDKNDANGPVSKRSRKSISINNLVKHNCKYHLGNYFISYVEKSHQHRHEEETHSFVLCTNEKVDSTLESHLNELPKTNILSFAQDIDALCYRINPSKPMPKLEEMLIDFSIDVLGKLFSRCIVSTNEDYQNKFSEGEPKVHVLFEVFSSLIEQALDKLGHDNVCGVAVVKCKFTTKFLNVNDTTELSKFKTALVKHKAKHIDTDTEFLIAKCLIRSPASGANREDIRSKIEQFYKSFVLIASSSCEQDLREIARERIPYYLDREQALTKLQVLMFNAVKNHSGVPITMDQKFVENTFQDLLCQKQLILQTNLSDKYISNLRTKHPYSAIKPDRTRTIPLYESIVKQNQNGGLHTFSSCYELGLSALIVKQMLDLVQHESLFIDSAQYQQSEELGENVKLILTRHKCAKQHVLIAVGKLEYSSYDSLRHLAHPWKIITIEQRFTDGLSEQQMCDRLRVCDLTMEEKVRLQAFCNDLSIYGTHVSFETIVNEKDDLSLLMPLLNAAKNSINYNKQNFEQIREWYIHRDFLSFHDAPELQDPLYKSSEIIKSLRECYFNREATFEEILQKLDTLQLLDKDDAVFDSACNAKTCDPPGFSDRCKSKVNILINDAGFGKSAYFTWLAWILTEKQPSLYVVKLNALEYSTDFERLDKHKIEDFDGTQIIRLLYHFVYLAHFASNVNRQTVAETDLIRDVGDYCAKLLRLSQDGQVVLDDDPSNIQGPITATRLLELRLFRDKLNAMQFVLLLDGFDEVAPYYKEAVLACLKRFSNLELIKTVYISSRPYDFEEDFRRTFPNCRMYRLKPFSQADQRVSLHKFLTRELQDTYERCEDRHRQLVLHILHGILDNALDDVKTVPLLLDMAFGKMLPAVMQHIDFRSHTVSGAIYKQEKFDTLQLVENFVERKLAIANTDKAGSTDSASKTAAAKQNRRHVNKAIQELHAVLAMYVMFASECRGKLLTKKEKNMAQQYLQNLSDVNTGLIIGTRDGIPLFGHRIFAEYFAACWLHMHEDRMRNESYFRSKSFWTYGLKRMRAFFDQLIIRERGGSDIHMAVLNDSTEQVLTLLSNNPDLARCKDMDDRTPLHLAVQKLCNHSDIRNAILERMTEDDINMKDKLFCWTALDYSFVTGNDNAIRELLQLRAVLNVNTFIKQLCSNNLDVILKQVHHYCEFLRAWEDYKQNVTIIYRRTVRHLIEERDLNIHACHEELGSISVLDYCTKYKMYEMFRQFVEQTGQPREVLTSVADSIIQLAIEAHAHEITNYLIDECNFAIPWIKCSRRLVYTALGLISLNGASSFRKVLNQLCLQRNIDCTNDSDIVTDYSIANGTHDLPPARGDEPKVCCVHNNTNVALSLEEYDGYDFVNDACVFEQLLTLAVHVGNLPLTSYIIQKKQMTITTSLIVAIMRLMPKLRGVRHARSIPCFNYLLDKTNNLYSTDVNGRNLLHMSIQNGCFYMVHCLIVKGFDTKLINSEHLWHAFHYVASIVYERNDRPIKTFNYLKKQPLEDFLHMPDTRGYKPFELAVLNNHFMLAKIMFEEMWNDTTSEEARLSELKKSIEQMIEQGDFEAMYEFMKFVSHDPGHIWMNMCSTIPVI